MAARESGGCGCSLRSGQPEARPVDLVRTLVWKEKTKGQKVSAGEPAFSPDGKWLVLSTQVAPDKRGDEPDVQDLPQPRIHLIDVATATIRETLIAPPGAGGSPCFSRDGRTLATAGRGRVVLWDLTKLPDTTARAGQP